MKSLRIYVDTSVIGGCLDDEFSLDSARRIHGFNSVNMRLGYAVLEIRSPKEVLSGEES